MHRDPQAICASPIARYAISQNFIEAGSLREWPVCQTGMMNRFVFDPPYIRRGNGRGRIDLWGIGLLALGFGALQVVLDTGQRKDWFSSDYIRFFAVLCVVGLVALVIRELTVEEPVVDLRALRNRSFSTGVCLITQLGFVLYASLVLLPIYLQILLGYPAYNAGLALSPRGLGSLAMMPVTGYLVSKIDPRKLMAVGLLLGAGTMLTKHNVTNDLRRLIHVARGGDRRPYSFISPNHSKATPYRRVRPQHRKHSTYHSERAPMFDTEYG